MRPAVLTPDPGREHSKSRDESERWPLQPGQDSIDKSERFFRQEAVPFIAEPDLYAVISQPDDAAVDFAVVDLLQFRGEIHACDCVAGESRTD